jgi:2-dehydro-3-deoxyphosphogluconate aldolase/(4S)-4-hydroxy-2-oxoglutarate aldolase
MFDGAIAMNDVLEQISVLGVVPVVAIDDANQAVALGQALIDGGLPCAEITFRTDAAEDAIKKMVSAFPEMLVGAGTVLTIEQAEKAVNAGARFIVTPGFDAAVVDWCIARDVPITPGVMTPTEINMALNKGLNVLKFFPAEAAGGIKTLKAISAPYGGVNFIPTGGIGPGNLADYLSLPMTVACGGSWLVKKQLIAAGDFQQITALTKEATEIVVASR